MHEAIQFWENWDIWLEAVLVAVIAAGTLAYLGVWIVLKKMTYVPLAISQVAALGVVVAFLAHEIFAAHEPSDQGLLILLEPSWFSFIFTAATAIFLARPGSRGDRPVVIAYVVAGALVLILSGFIRQDIHDIRSILFGHTVLAEITQVILVASVAFTVLVVHFLFYKRFLFVSYDPIAAGAAGIPVYLTDALLFITLAIMLSAATRSMGALPSFGLTVLPAFAGLQLGRTMGQTILFSVVVGIISAACGYYLSFVMDLSAGALMVAFAASLLLASWLIRKYIL